MLGQDTVLCYLLRTACISDSVAFPKCSYKTEWRLAETYTLRNWRSVWGLASGDQAMPSGQKLIWTWEGVEAALGLQGPFWVAHNCARGAARPMICSDHPITHRLGNGTEVDGPFTRLRDLIDGLQGIAIAHGAPLATVADIVRVDEDDCGYGSREIAGEWLIHQRNVTKYGSEGATLQLLPDPDDTGRSQVQIAVDALNLALTPESRIRMYARWGAQQSGTV